MVTAPATLLRKVLANSRNALFLTVVPHIYALPSMNLVVNCPIYFSRLTALSSTCHAQDQASTTLHEMAHAPAVYSPYCQDNGYGYAAATRLTSALTVLNAGSYALYANGELDDGDDRNPHDSPLTICSYLCWMLDWWFRW